MRSLKFLFGIVACVSTYHAEAQNDFALWSLNDKAGAARRLNPAFTQKSKLQIGLPVLSSYEFGIGNSGFTLSQVTHFNGDTLVFDATKLPGVLRDKNFFYLSQNAGLFSICINQPRYSAEVFAELRTHLVFEYPGDLIKLAVDGNAAHLNETLAVGNIGLDMTNYVDLGVRVARHFGKLTVGATPKLLVGLQNIRTLRNDVTLRADETTYALDGSMNVQINTSGFFDSTFATGIHANRMMQDMKGFHNLGAAVDIGGVYAYSDKWTFAASVNDIGRIRWKSMVRNFSSRGNYAFTGVDLYQLIGQTDTTNGFGQLIDSLGHVFRMEESKHAYTTWIPAKAYASAAYKLRASTTAEVMLSGEWNTRRFAPALGLSLTQHVGRKLAASIVYSYYNRDWFNVGFGLWTGLGPFEFFLSSDNALGAINYLKFRNAHVRTGIELAFGREHRKRSRK